MIRNRNKINYVKIQSIFLRGLNLSILFLTTIYIARILGPEEYGRYSVYLSTFNLLTIPFMTGISTFLVREVSKADDVELRIKPILYSKNILIYFAIFLTIGFIGYGLYNGFNRFLILGLLYSIFCAISGAFSSILRGVKKVILSFTTELVVRPIIVAILVLFISRVYKLSGEYVLTIQTLSYLLITLILVILTKKEINWTNKYWVLNTGYTGYNKTISLLLLLSLLQLSNNYSDILFLKAFRENIDVGIYRAISQLGSTMLIGLMAINQVIQPQIDTLLKKSTEELQKLIRNSWIYINIFSSFLGVILFLFAEKLLIVLFNYDYATQDAVITFRIYIIGMLINTFFGSVGTILNMTHNEYLTIRGMILGIISNLVLNLFLVPTYGMIGTAISSATTLLIWNFVLWWYTLNKIRINSIGIFNFSKK